MNEKTFRDFMARRYCEAEEFANIAEEAWELATLAEREACAKLCDEQAESESIEPFQYGAEACAKAIRERGEQK